MKRNFIASFLIAALSFAFILPSQAQEEETQSPASTGQALKTWSITLSPGIVHPYTDIRYRDFWGTGKPKNENQFGGSLKVTKMLSGAFGVQGQFVYANVLGVVDKEVKAVEDKLNIQKGLSSFIDFNKYSEGIYFKTTVMQGNVNLYWNISNSIFGINRYFKAAEKGEPIKDRKLSFYTYVGIGLASFNTSLYNTANDQKLDSLSYLEGGETGRTNEIVIPVGLGVKYKVSKTIDVGLDYSFHNLFSDKLDGVVLNYPRRKPNDSYSFLGLTVDVKIGGKKKSKEHIEWVNPTERLYSDIKDVVNKMEKLSKDSDGDGVPDMFDKEPNTPAGVAVDGSGRALDVDGDGIPDFNDDDPFTAKGAQVDSKGVPVDSDGDGVPDHLDKEPNTPKGTFVNFEGIAIPNAVAQQLEKEGKLGGGGVSALPSVFFDLNSSTLKRDYKLSLFTIARLMMENPSYKVRLVGNCDVRGSESYNQELGKQRADIVAQYLSDNFGIDANRISTISEGKGSPVSKIHEVNRRVDVFIVK